MKPQSCPGQYVLDGHGNMSGSGASRVFQGSGNGHGTEDTTAGEEMI